MGWIADAQDDFFRCAEEERVIAVAMASDDDKAAEESDKHMRQSIHEWSTRFPE